MSFLDFKRSASSIRLLADYGRERGMAMEALLANSKLTPSQLDDPKFEVSATQELAVVRNLMKGLKKAPELAVEAGSRYHFSAYGIWGFGLISSPSAGEALALALRFLPLTYAFSRISYHEVGAFGILNFGEPDLPADLGRFLVQRDMAAAVTLLNEIMGSPPVSRVTLCASPLPRDAARLTQAWQGLSGVRPEFGSQSNSLVFERRHLDRILPQADASSYAMCVQMCQQLMESRRARIGTAALVRQCLGVASAGALPTLTDVARQLHTSGRTLKRRLQDEGTTFREILADSARERALDLLQDRQLKLADIAESLGFSDLSSFSQAFKRWYGMAPSKYRQGK